MGLFVDDVRVFQENSNRNVVYFDDWLAANGFVPHKLLRETMFSCGCLECEVTAWIERLKEDFEEWCKDNAIEAILEKEKDMTVCN